MKGNYKEAEPSYLEAAAKGSPEMQYIIGLCYKEGRAVDKNDSIADEFILN